MLHRDRDLQHRPWRQRKGFHFLNDLSFLRVKFYHPERFLFKTFCDRCSLNWARIDHRYRQVLPIQALIQLLGSMNVARENCWKIIRHPFWWDIFPIFPKSIVDRSNPGSLKCLVSAEETTIPFYIFESGLLQKNGKLLTNFSGKRKAGQSKPDLIYFLSECKGAVKDMNIIMT